MSVHINDLCCDLLIYLFSFLPNKQIFMIECVSKKWKKCVNKLMKRRITELNFICQDFSGYFKIKQPNVFDHHEHENCRHFIIDDNNIEILKVILSKCSIKHFKLFSTFVSVNNLISISNLCPKLESINFGCNNIIGTEEEWEQFGLIVGPKLIKHHINCLEWPFHDSSQAKIQIQIILKHLKNIEEIIIVSRDKYVKEIFDHLNSCQKLTKLSFISHYIVGDDHHNIETNNQNMINVLQRVQFLNIEFRCFRQLNIQWNNLTELTLKFYDDSFLNGIKANAMTFSYLKKLTIIIMTLRKPNLSLISIAELKFPNLEYLNLINTFCLYDWSGWNESFINNFRSIQMLFCYHHKFDLKYLSFMENLIQFEFIFSFDDDNENDFGYLIQLFDAVSRHKSLQKIKFIFGEGLFNLKLFEKLISLHHAKPNLQIRIHDCNSNHKNRQLIDEYKKKHEETKHLTKINIFYFNHHYNIFTS